MQWHQHTAEEAMAELSTSEKGLSSDAVRQLQRQHGKNELTGQERRSKWAILLSQFDDIMIIILIGAAVISFIAGDPVDAYVILAIIIGNALMGFIQENNAEESLAMLRNMSVGKTIVTRGQKEIEISVEELVPGDIIHLESGSVVPADARLWEIASVKTNESALTGESASVEKTIDPLPDENLPVSDQTNMIFKGTTISNGTAKAIVTATGMKTELGKIAGMLQSKETKTPLQKRLQRFSKQLAVIIILICIVVFGLGILRGEPSMSMLLIALSLAVAALPEALPAVITIALASGARRMVKQKALIRNLPAVETLGSVTYICTDKTGTLTQNVMHVEKVETTEDQNELLHFAMALNQGLKITEDKKMHGDSTEIAMVNYAQENGITIEDAQQKYPKVAELPFDSDRMRMSTLHRDGDKYVMITKGAPIKVVEVLAGASEAEKKKWLDLNRQWAAEGFRVLFFAYKHMDVEKKELTPEDETDLSLLGIVGLIDPPREEVIEAIQQCKTAGIRIVMITGDQALTAQAIADRLTIRDEDSPPPMTGMEMQEWGPDKLSKEVKNITVYARVSPEQKMTIVESLQQQGQFVAMTGDGVNDAPSLKKADIGIAMGITGTDVAKEASDMVLLDDHFNTIVSAVKEGRRIYENIRKFLLYVLSCNAAEILVILFAPLLGMIVPLLPTHILWINLMTDGFPGLALTQEAAEPDIMKKPPRPPDENIFAEKMGLRIVITGMLMAVLCLVFQKWLDANDHSARIQQTFIFTLLCLSQLINAISIRSYKGIFRRKKFFANRRLWWAVGLIVILQVMIIYLPFLQRIFKTEALSAQHVGLLGVGLVLHLVGFEMISMGFRKWRKRRTNKP